MPTIFVFFGFDHGFKKQQIALIESIIEENVEVISERWKVYFNK
jgi:hypothetical protein